jgi:phosphatidylglycerophosphate synthase
MNYFWNWLVEQYPLWLAPNLITLAGLIVNISSVLILGWFSIDGKASAPWWSYLYCGVALFAYQALDATDGKQARRTKSASPLGELFDHGCDSLSQVFISLEILLALQFGFYPDVMLWICMISLVLFYSAHWQTYCSGTMKFYKFDVTEAQILVMLLCATTSAFSPKIWSYKPFGFWEIKVWIMVWFLLMAANQLYCYFHVVFTGGVGKNGSTVAGTSVLFPGVPLALATLPGFIIYYKSATGVFVSHIVLYLIMNGLVLSKVTNRVIIAHMSKSELTSMDSILLGPLMLCLNQYFNTVIPEYPLLLVVTVYCSLNLLAYCYVICTQICDYLDIQCFRIALPARVGSASSSGRESGAVPVKTGSGSSTAAAASMNDSAWIGSGRKFEEGFGTLRSNPVVEVRVRSFGGTGS